MQKKRMCLYRYIHIVIIKIVFGIIGLNALQFKVIFFSEHSFVINVEACFIWRVNKIINIAFHFATFVIAVFREF